MAQSVPAPSRRFRSGPAVARAAAVAVALLLAVVDDAVAAVPWHVDLAQAKAASQISRRPILILFVADWSEASVQHERTFLGTDEAVALLTACFEPVKIDVDADKATPARLDVVHLPCACVIDVEERVLSRFDCPESSAAFVAAAGRAAQDAAVACAGPLPPAPAPAPAATSDTVVAPPQPAPTVAAAAPLSPPATAPATPVTAAPEPPAATAAPAAPWPAETATAPLAAPAPEAPARSPAPLPAAPVPPGVPAPGGDAAPQAAATALEARTAPAPTWLDQPPAAAPSPAAAPAPAEKKPNGFWAAVQKPFTTLVGKPAKPADAAVPPAEIPSTGVPGAAPGTSMPVGLEGYCPVTLVEKGQWTEGRAKWGVRHRGRTYLCAGPEEQRAFLANPDRFSPGLSGDDPVLAFDSGKKVPGQRQYGVSYRSKIYLFASPDSQAAFKVDPQKYAQRVQVAEQAVGAPTLR